MKKKADYRFGLVALLVFLILFSLFVFYIKPGITGKAVAEEQHDYSQSIDETFNASSEYIWEFENHGNLKSLKLSGLVSTSGSARVYLQGDRRYLIFDSSELINSQITGFAVSDITINESLLINETDNLSMPEENITIPENITEEINLTDTNLTDINLTDDEIAENTTEVNLTENLTEIHIPKFVYFDDICIETCSLDGLNESSYNLIIEIEDAELIIAEIDYTVVESAVVEEEIVNETISEPGVEEEITAPVPAKTYGMMAAEINSTVILNSTFGTNGSNENLTVYYTLNDTNAKGIINWYKNGQSIMVLSMPFEGGSNSTFTKDYSGFGNDGTVINATFNATGGYDGKGAYEFNGSEYSYIEISDSNSLDITHEITIEVWVKDPPAGTELITSVAPASTSGPALCIPFGAGTSWGGTYKGFQYKNVSAFNLNVGDYICFDLGAQNDYDITMNVDICHTSINGDTTCTPNSDCCDGNGYTRVSTSKTAIPNPRGDTSCTTFNLCFEVNTSYSFPGQGMDIRVSPAGSFASDATCDQVQCYTDSNDASGYFVRRWTNEGSQTSTTYLSGVEFYSAAKKFLGKGRNAYQLEIDDNLNLSGFINNNEVNYQITKAWHHVVMTYNGSEQRLYVDGILRDSNSFSGTINTNSNNLIIGQRVNGSIDEIRIYNMSLSAEQVRALYENRTDLIVSQETSEFESWQACITPNDGYVDGATNCSNNLTIRDTTLPAVNLVSPEDDYKDKDGSVTFVCNATNIDLANITLWTNITGWQANQTNIVTGTANETSFNLTNIDYGTYIWNCEAYDSSGNSAFAAANRTFIIEPNFPPTQALPILNSTSGQNLTTDNLTVYNQSTFDQNGDPVKNIINWYKNGQSIMVLSMPFEGGSNSTFTKDYSSHGNNGTIINATFNATGGYDGKGAYEFNGSEYSYIEISDSNSLDITHEITIEVWVKDPPINTKICATNTYYRYSSFDCNPSSFCVFVDYYVGQDDTIGDISFDLSSLSDVTITSAQICAYRWTGGGTNPTNYIQKVNSISCSSAPIVNAVPTTDIIGSAMVSSTNGWKCISITPSEVPIDSTFYIRWWGQDLGGSLQPYNCYRGPGATISNCGGSNPCGASNCAPYIDINYEKIPATIVGKGTAAYEIQIDDNLNLSGFINNNEVNYQITKAWHHVVMTYNGSEQRLYVDGILRDSNSFSGTINTNSNNLIIGQRVNGSIDEIRIYNMSLSAEQVRVLYENRTDLIVSQETSEFEIWQACITPNDGYIDGTENCSNTLTIRDTTPPVVNLVSPENNYEDVNGNITFACNATNLNLTNISLWTNTTGWHRNKTKTITGTYNQTSFNPVIIPNGAYKWNCEAYDSSGNSDFAPANRTFYVVPPVYPNVTNFSTDYGTTNFSAVPDLQNVTNLTLANQYGKIQFPVDWGVDAHNQDYDKHVIIGDRFISVNLSALHPTFNHTANLTINVVACPATIYYGNNTYTSAEEIIGEGNECNESTSPACTIVGCSNNKITFTINHYTGFAGSSNANLTIWDETDFGMPYGNQIKQPNEQIKFFANYTNSSGIIFDANCSINFTDNSGYMSYNSTTGFFEYNRSFANKGGYDWNVTCNKTGYDNLTASDNVGVGGSPVNSCQILNQANAAYLLTTNITNNSLTQACINITASNITFDCNGNYIKSSNDVPGVYSNKENTTIKNCNITMGTFSGGKGIYLLKANNSRILNNILSNTHTGLYSDQTNYTIIENNIINNNNYEGIELQACSYSSLINNTANYNSYYGIYLYNGKNNSLINNTANNNYNLFGPGDGILLLSSSNNSLVNNTANNNNRHGIHIYLSSDNNDITYNTVSNNSKYGIYIQNSNYNNLINNTVSNNTLYNINLHSSKWNSLIDNKNNYRYGILLNLSSNNNLTSNILNNNIYALELYNSSSNNIISGSNVYNSSSIGIYLNINATNNAFSNNTLNNCSTGINISKSSYNTFLNNYIDKGSSGIIIYSSLAFPTPFNASHNIFRNLNITNVTAVSVKLDDNVGSFNLNNTFVNASYQNETLDANSQLIRKWYYQAYVNDTNGNNVENADVRIYNVSDDSIENLTTDSNGLTSVAELVDYINNGGTKNYYSNYNIRAEKSLTHTAKEVSRNLTQEQNMLPDIITLEIFGIAVDSCQELNQPNIKYFLTADIVNNSLTDSCIKITAENITFDCLGYSILSDNSVAGVYINQTGTIIKNCNISMGTTPGYGVVIDDADNSQVIDSTIYNQSYGIYCNHSSNILIKNNIIKDHTIYGIWFENCSNSTEIDASSPGSGIELDPYKITDCDDLQNIKNDLDAYYILSNDIDCNVAPYNTGSGFEPIGNSTDSFNGNLDGNLKKIRNLFINRPSTDYIGLFGIISNSAVINKLGLENVNITGRNYVGALAGRSDGNINNVFSKGYVNGTDNVGGLVGYNNKILSNSYSTANVNGSSNIGGLAGYSNNINNSYATGNVTGNTNVGGLIGNNVGAVTNSYWYYHIGNPDNCTGNNSGDPSGCSAVEDESLFYYGISPIDQWDLDYIWHITGTDHPDLNASAVLFAPVGYGIISNTLLNNSYGIYFEKSSLNQIVSNSIAESSNYGIQLDSDSDDNLIYNNKLNNNITNSNDAGANYWNTTYTCSSGLNILGRECLGGNSWNDYNGTDTDDDGIGDTNVPFNGDYLPLVNFAGLDIKLVWPNGTEYYICNEFNEFTVNVSCTSVTSCGQVNVSLDPEYSIQAVTEITNCNQLQNMKNNLVGSYKLANDIDCADTVNWNSGQGFEPVGNATNPFNGTFDGNFKRIKNLYINRATYYIGLFGRIDSNATIKNVGLENANITHFRVPFYTAYTGSLVGNNRGNIDRAYATGYIQCNSSDGIGGLVGYNTGNITNSYANMNISNSSSIGGLVGGHFGGSILNSYATGIINGSDNYNKGGFACIVTSGNINNSFSTAKVFGENSAGMIGSNSITISNLYWYNHSDDNTARCCISGTCTSCYNRTPISYFYDRSNAPMNAWDFTSIWRENADNYPSLRGFEAAVIYNVANPPSGTNYADEDGNIISSTSTGYVYLNKDGINLVKLNINGSIDLSGAAADTNGEKSLLHFGIASKTNITTVELILKKHSTNFVRICPSAVTLSQITAGCTNEIILTSSNNSYGNYSIINLGDNRYWHVTADASIFSTGAESGGKGGLIPYGSGEPFWTNTSNPYTLNLNSGESELITFWVNASCNYTGYIYEFFANASSSLYGITDKTDIVDIVISEPECEHKYLGKRINESIPVYNAISIENCSGLQGIKNNLSEYYILENDIDCSDTAAWNNGKGFVPIGNSTSKFTGIFDGQGYRITGLYINRTAENYVGLFGYTDGAVIQEVGIEDANITGQGRTGALVGWNKDTNIIDCYAKGIVKNGSSSNSYGGLIGYNDGGDVKNCYADVKVNGSHYTGGLIGENLNAEIVNSFSVNNVSGETGETGGLIGRNYNTGIIINSHWFNTSGNPDYCWTNSSGSYNDGCTAVNESEGADYFYNSSNPPLNTWYFTSVWKEETNDYPALITESWHNMTENESTFDHADKEYELISEYNRTFPEEGIYDQTAICSALGWFTLQKYDNMTINPAVEFQLGDHDWCRIDGDDDLDGKPALSSQSSCVDNRLNVAQSALNLGQLSSTDCWARYQVCGPCPQVENYTYDSCADSIDNDYDDGAGNYDGFGSGGINCEDSDCLNELASYKGTRCVAAGGESTEALCSDGADNDGDGNVDCADANCGATTVCTSPDYTVNETTLNYKLDRAFYDSNNLCETCTEIFDTGDFNFTSSKTYASSNNCILRVLDQAKSYSVFEITFNGITNGNNLSCSLSFDLADYLPQTDGIYFLEMGVNHTDGYVFNSSHKVFYVCDSSDLSASGTDADGLKWSCAKADLDNDGWTEGLYTTLYGAAQPCDTCPGEVNTGLDDDGDGIDNVCDIEGENFTLELPEGIYEPFCCNDSGVIKTGDAAIAAGCDPGKNSNDDLNCDTGEILYGTHPHTFNIKFINISVNIGATAECIINKSNETQFTISRTINQNLINDNFTINYTIANASFEEINRSKPWEIISCSVKDNLGTVQFYSDTSRTDYNLNYWKIYIDRNTWPLTGAGRQSTEAAFCYLQSTRENGYRDNAVTCDYSGDVQHAIDIKLGAEIPSAEECKGANCSNYACKGITYLTCYGDRTANEYFTLHPWAVAPSFRILGSSSYETQDFGNCNANTNICTGTISSGSLTTTYYYTYRSKSDGTLKVKFVNSGGAITTASEMGNTIGQIDTTTVNSNTVGKYPYPSADGINLSTDNVEAFAYTTKQTGVSNKRVWQVMYINFTNAGDPPASENIRTAIVWEGSAANIDNNPWIVDNANAPSNWNENDAKLWGGVHETNKYIYGQYNMVQSQSNNPCNDREDNDLDWHYDCRDLDCNGVLIGKTVGGDDIRCEHDGSENFVYDGEVTCWDGYDNDHDNLVDCADPDCNNSIGAYYVGDTPVKYNTSSSKVAMCEYGSAAEGTINYTSTPSSCNDTFNNDADAGNQWLNYACDSTDPNECYNETTDCYDRYSCWGRSGTDSGICPLRENTTALCQNTIDDDFDDRPINPASFNNWMNIYNPRAGSAAQNRTDCLDYDCYGITDGGNYLCSTDPTTITEYNGTDSDDARRTCWDSIDNDLDWYYWNSSANPPYGNYILNSSTGYDCDDPDCFKVINPNNPAQQCLEQEFKLGFYDFCRDINEFGNKEVLDDDFDLKPAGSDVFSCTDNRLNDTASALNLGQLGSTDCWAIYQVCGPCPSVENYTYGSCADDINNDYDTATNGNYGSGGTDCADDDCLNELGSYKGAVCTNAENSNLLCSDGFDNDAAGGTDCGDANCNGFNGPDGQVCQSSESGLYCYDSYDNDGDNNADCADTGCYNQPGCIDITAIPAGTYCGAIPSTSTGNPGSTGISYTHETREHINEDYTISFSGDIGWNSATITLGAASNPFPYSTSCVLSGANANKFELTSLAGFINVRIQSKSGADISSPWSVTLNCPGNDTAGNILDYFLQINGLKSGQPKDGSATLSTIWFETTPPTVTKIIIGGNQSNNLTLKYGQSYTMLANATDATTGNNGICGCGFSISDPSETTSIQTSPKCRYTTAGQVRDIDNVQITSRAQDGAYNFGPYESPLNFRLKILPIDTTSNYKLDRAFYNATEYTILDTGTFSFITGQDDSFTACNIHILNGSKSLVQTFAASISKPTSYEIACSLNNLNLSTTNLNMSKDGIYFIYANTTDSDLDPVNSSYKIFYVCNDLTSSGTTPEGLKWTCAKADLDNDGWTEGLYTTLYTNPPVNGPVQACDSCPPPIVNTGRDSDGDGIDDACDSVANLIIWDTTDGTCVDDNDCPGGYECKSGVCIRENDNRRPLIAKLPGDLINFYANYTDESNATIIDAVCTIFFDDLNDTMVFNSARQLYEFNRTFSSAGTYLWNVTCAVEGAFNVANDTVTISSRVVPPVPPPGPPAPGIGAKRLTVCAEDWNCTEWGPCQPDGIQSRICYDLNNCDELYNQRVVLHINRSFKPEEVRECVYEPKCYDGIFNGNESDIDCGGLVCPKCADGKRCRVDEDCINLCNETTKICYSPERLPLRLRPPLALIVSMILLILLIVEIATYRYQREWMHRTIEHYKAGRIAAGRERTLRRQRKERLRKAEEAAKKREELSRLREKEAEKRRKAARKAAEERKAELEERRRTMLKALEKARARREELRRTKLEEEAERARKAAEERKAELEEATRRKYESAIESVKDRIERLEAERRFKLRRAEDVEKIRQEYTESLNTFLTKAVNQGYDKGQIKRMLISKGWPKKIAIEYCDKFFEKNQEAILEAKKQIMKAKGITTNEEIIKEIRRQEKMAKKRLKELENKLLEIDKRMHGK